MTDPSDFYLNQSEPNKECLLALRSIILEFDDRMTETVKYGMPCFCLHNRAVLYLWTDKKTKEPYILVIDGMLIDHPLLEQGDRKRAKIFRVDPKSDIDLTTVRELLNSVVKVRDE